MQQLSELCVFYLNKTLLKMKCTRILIAAVIILTATASTVSAQKETRDHKNFTGIGFGVAGDLYLKTGSVYSVVLEGDKDLLAKITTEVRDNKLIFRHDNYRWTGNEKVVVYITMPTVESLSLSGSGKIMVESPLNGESLKLSISGSGRLISGDLNYEEISCSISGSGNFEFNGKGKVTDADLAISGSGGYKAPALELANLDVRISGSGSCDCFVTEMLEASISGSGNVLYAGNPRIDIRSSGSGKVRSK
jgi:hypothetical protein